MPTTSALEQLRQASEEFAVVPRDISALQERIKLLQDAASARMADENNRSLFILTMVTVRRPAPQRTHSD